MQILQWFKSKKKILTIFLLVTLLVFLTFFKYNYYGPVIYRHEWTTCATYISQNVLWTGQPRCAGTLFPLYIIWISNIIFGQENTQMAMIIFATIISIIFFLILWKVIKREREHADWRFSLLLFWLLIYLNISVNVESLLSSFFIFTAYYFCFYSQSIWKYYLTGIFILFAMISKPNAIVPIFLLLLGCGLERFNTLKTKNKEEQKKNFKLIIIMYGSIFFPVLFGLILIVKKFPYFWIYMWQFFQEEPELVKKLPEVIRILTFQQGIDLSYLLLLVITFLGLFVYLKERKSYSVILGPGIAITIFLYTKAFGMLTGFHYYMVFFPFVILCLLDLKERWTLPPLKQIFQCIIIMIIIFPGMYFGVFQIKDELGYISPVDFIHKLSPAWKEKNIFLKEIHYGYSIIPDQKGRILVEQDSKEFERKYVTIGMNIPYDNVDFINSAFTESYADGSALPVFKQIFGDNLIYNPNEEGVNKYEDEIIKKIENNEYSLIIEGPPEWLITNRMFSKLQKGTLDTYCIVFVPNNFILGAGVRDYSLFIFQESEDCSVMLGELYNYYALHYKEICAKDKFIATAISAVMRKNELQFPYTCIDGGDSLEFYQSNTGIKRTDLLILLGLIISIFLFGFPTVLKNKDLNKVNKWVYWSLLLFFIVCFLVALFILPTTVSSEEAVVTLLGK